MDFTFSTEQQMLSDSIERFLQNDYDFESRARRVAAGNGGDAATWQFFADNGWLAAACPEQLGGFGGGVIENAIIAGQFGRALVIEPWLGCAVLATQTLLATEDNALKAELLPSLCDGSKRLALAWSEEEARGVPYIVGTRVHNADQDTRLNGRKTLVLGAAGADSYIVSARESGELAERSGIALFLVDGQAQGLFVDPTPLHDGTTAATLTLKNVPARRLDGDGLVALEAGLAHAICAMSAELVGAMERSIEMSADYLKTRKQFGVPLGSFQSLQHRIADMAAELELARSMLFAALASHDHDFGDGRMAVLAGAKSLITSAARNVCGQAIQLHGGIGMTEEYAIGHFFKRAVVADALLGGRILQDRICAKLMLKQILEAGA